MGPNEKRCPYCAETIKWEAIICRHCNRDLREFVPAATAAKSPSNSKWVRKFGPLECIGVVVILFFAGCYFTAGTSTNGNAGSSVNTDTAASSDSATHSAPQADPRFKAATPQYLKDIKAGVNESVTLMPTGYMTRATSYKDVWLVAGKLTGEGMGNGEWAVWAVGGGDGTAMGHSVIMCADNMASEFSEWPKGETSKAELSVTDPDVQALKSYVKDK